jgi:hypothetical protein
MVDYYPVLARAVAGLPHNDAQARRDLYTRARTIVAEQMRARGPQGTARETMREQTALESAIRKIEAETRSSQSRTIGKPAPPPAPRNPPTAADARQGVNNTARSLSKILQAVQTDETGVASPRPLRRPAANATKALLPRAEPETAAMRSDRKPSASAELGGAPSSLGTLLFATAYIVAALAFTGVTYIRCMVWLYQGAIGYPILLGAMAVTLALFIVPPVMVFRKTSASPTIDVLLRYIHSASRRVL